MKFIHRALCLGLLAMSLASCGSSSSVDYPTEYTPDLSSAVAGSSYLATASITLKAPSGKRVRNCVVDFGFYGDGKTIIGTVYDGTVASPMYDTIRIGFAEVESGPLRQNEAWYCAGSALLPEKPTVATIARIEYSFE